MLAVFMGLQRNLYLFNKALKIQKLSGDGRSKSVVGMAKK
ncbi:hypothetical protein ACZ87_02520 [Candidatus Erwinia dacicola]|uniref:Uncharacterized protein n=1 Tax=Candidatus Erwinia dacicola TaxID=252393 RepID=A0A328TJP3_9GAMM|nr:hypothetical protein ACZ87_02520 [Candidatus Erwinia dacicola]